MLIGFLLDLWLGDPQSAWHPICLIGRAISALEKGLRRMLPKDKRGECVGGVLLVVGVLCVSVGVPALLLWLCSLCSPWLLFAVDALLCWLLLSVRTLRVESMQVYDALAKHDLNLARVRVQRIVGRDAAVLDEAGVARATVETIAESTVDGVLSPLLYMALGGSVLCFLYKAVNTMDSMVGYRNDRYRYFGKAAARLDDVLNFLPARIGGALMCVATFCCGFDGKHAWHIFRRDRLKHASPNSAHTEAAMAGALGVTLGGDAVYFGTLHKKPTQGDGCAPTTEDIPRANRLMYGTAFVSLMLCILLRIGLLWIGGCI